VAWTQSDVDALRAHIAARLAGGQGRRVQFADRSVEFDALEDCYKLLQVMEADVKAAGATPRPRMYFLDAGKGI
jgi:hypothetical protein